MDKHKVSGLEFKIFLVEQFQVMAELRVWPWEQIAVNGPGGLLHGVYPNTPQPQLGSSETDPIILSSTGKGYAALSFLSCLPTNSQRNSSFS